MQKLVMVIILAAAFVLGSIATSSATDPLNRLRHRVARLEDVVSGIHYEIYRCYGTINVTNTGGVLSVTPAGMAPDYILVRERDC